MKPFAGRVIAGRYQIIEKIGSGGMGAIFKATDKITGHNVVVKGLHSFRRTDTNIKRFRKEAEILKQLKHPNIVSFIDYLTWEDELFIVLEYLDGTSLQEKISKGAKMELDEIASVFFQLINALESAHDQQIVHRDLKPSNIFCVSKENSGTHIKLLDFGISISLSDDPEARLTKTGEIVGTPYYLSPEHITRSQEITIRSDIYSLGVITYELLAGFPPFSGQNDMDILLGHLYRQVPLIERPDLKQQPMYKKLTQIVYRSLKKNSDDRFASISEMRELIEMTSDPSQTKSSRFINDRISRHRESIHKPSESKNNSETTKKLVLSKRDYDDTFEIPPLFKNDNGTELFEDENIAVEKSLIPLLDVSRLPFNLNTNADDLTGEDHPAISMAILNLGNKSNLKILKEMRNNDKFRTIPIIVCGEAADLDLMSASINNGATDYFSTPYCPDEIIRKIKKYTGGPES